MSVLVVGSIALDSVETPFGKRDNVLGGSASYFSTAASFFTHVHAVGVVGQDFPKEHLEFLKNRGADLEGVTAETGKTFRWSGRYDHDMNVAHTLDTQLNVFADFSPKIPEPYRGIQNVFLGNIDPALQRSVLEQVEKPRLVACDTMNFWIEGSRESLLETLKRVDLLSINDGEARLLSNEYSLIAAAKYIQSLGPKTLVIKRGEYGVLLFHEGHMFATPAFLLEDVRDPTGAGDTFAGGLLGYLAAQPDINATSLRTGVVMGSVMASFVVEDFSLDRLRSLTKPEIAQRFDAFRSFTQFELPDLN